VAKACAPQLRNQRAPQRARANLKWVFRHIATLRRGRLSTVARGAYVQVASRKVA
jgi:hypothetical protein